MIKEKTFHKYLCLGWLIAAFIYGIALPFFWGNDPMDPLGTLSVLCGTHKPFFWLWVLVCCGGNFMNTNYMYKRYRCDKKWLFALSVVALLSACVVALTLGHSVADWNPKRIAHWVSTGFYVGALALSIALFGLLRMKENKRFAVIPAAAVVILLIFVLWLVLIGKSGVNEMIPYALLQLLLFFVNYTNVFGLAESE